ncbi:hypothetical protein C5167_003091, partial [Papaver somniferum]
GRVAGKARNYPTLPAYPPIYTIDLCRWFSFNLCRWFSFLETNPIYIVSIGLPLPSLLSFSQPQLSLGFLMKPLSHISNFYLNLRNRRLFIIPSQIQSNLNLTNRSLFITPSQIKTRESAEIKIKLFFIVTQNLV